MSTSRGIAPATGTSTTCVAGAVEQLPHALVAVQRRELIERAARERQRVAAAVVVGARGERGVASPGEQLRHGCGGDAGLVSQQQDQDLAAGIDGGERGCDRRGAARAEVVVRCDLDAVQVDGLRDLGRAAADDTDQLVEVAGARGAEHVVEERRRPVRQQLLGLAQPLRAAGGEHEPGGERNAHGDGIPRIACHTRDGVHGMST